MPTRTRFLVALSILCAVLLIACTGDGESGASASTSSSEGGGVVTDDVDVAYVPGEFQYRYNNVSARFSMNGGAGILTVKNGSGAEIGPPAIYVIGVDDRRYDTAVSDAAAIADGGEVTLDVILPEEVASDSVGLVVLLFGGSNYGAMSPVPAG